MIRVGYRVERGNEQQEGLLFRGGVAEDVIARGAQSLGLHDGKLLNGKLAGLWKTGRAANPSTVAAVVLPDLHIELDLAELTGRAVQPLWFRDDHLQQPALEGPATRVDLVVFLQDLIKEANSLVIGHPQGSSALHESDSNFSVGVEIGQQDRGVSLRVLLIDTNSRIQKEINQE